MVALVATRRTECSNVRAVWLFPVLLAGLAQEAVRPDQKQLF